MRYILKALMILTLLKEVVASDHIRETPYPPIEPYKTYKVAVSDLHTIYFEESGNPKGISVLLVQGAGTATCASDRTWFDPEFYRIILFDPRGCGKSEAAKEVENSDSDLISDMKFIRRYLEIDKWLIFSGSPAGSTVSKLYSQKYRQSCLGLILSAIYSNSQAELMKAIERFKFKYSSSKGSLQH